MSFGVLGMAAGAPVLLASGYLVINDLPNSSCWNSVYRLLPAGVLLILPSLRLPQGNWWWKSATMGALNFGAYFAFQALAVHRLTPGLAATLVATTTLFAPLLLIPLGFALRLRQLASAAASVVGLSFAAGWLVLLPSATRFDAIGICAGISAALCLAGGKVLTTYWGKPPDMPSAAATGWQLIGGGLVLIPVAYFAESTPPVLDAAEWWATAWLAVVGTALAYGLQIGALHRNMSPAVVSQLALLCPLTAAVLDWLQTPRAPGVAQILGAGAMVTAIIVGTYAALYRVPPTDLETGHQVSDAMSQLSGS